MDDRVNQHDALHRLNQGDMRIRRRMPTWGWRQDMANAGATFDFLILEYDTEIIVNTGMTDIESALLGENPSNEKIILAPLESKRRAKIEVAGNGVLRAPDYQE